MTWRARVDKCLPKTAAASFRSGSVSKLATMSNCACQSRPPNSMGKAKGKSIAQRVFELLEIASARYSQTRTRSSEPASLPSGASAARRRLPFDQSTSKSANQAVFPDLLAPLKSTPQTRCKSGSVIMLTGVALTSSTTDVRILVGEVGTCLYGQEGLWMGPMTASSSCPAREFLI